MMQTAFTQIPTPEAQTVAVAMLFFMAGMAVPTRYGMERVEGFGRWVAAKLPFKPRPGTDEETSMRRAVGQEQTDEQADNGGN
ncbi:hypothetical protein [Haloarcula sp. H-GB5]